MNDLADLAMIIVYWTLTLLWMIVVSVSIGFLVWRPVFAQIKTARRVMFGFIALAIIFLLDSLYWSITNSSRVGVLSNSVHLYLYNGWAVATIKSLVLLSTGIFWVTVVRTFRDFEHRMERLYFTHFADQVDDAIGVLSPLGTVYFWNRGAEKLYGHQFDDVRGRHIKEFLVPQELHYNIDGLLKRIRETHKPAHFVTHRLRSDGSKIAVDIKISPFVDGQEFAGYFGIMREVLPVDEYIRASSSLRPIEAFSDGATGRAPDKASIIHQAIGEVYAEEQRDFRQRRLLAASTAVGLLILAAILTVMGWIGEGQHKWLFGTGSILTIFGELWPIRVLLQRSSRNPVKEVFVRLLQQESITHDEIQATVDYLNEIERKANNIVPPDVEAGATKTDTLENRLGRR